MNSKEFRQDTGEKDKEMGLVENEDPRFTMAEYDDLEMIQNYEFEFRGMGFSRETDAIDIFQDDDYKEQDLTRKTQSDTFIFKNDTNQ